MADTTITQAVALIVAQFFRDMLETTSTVAASILQDQAVQNNILRGERKPNSRFLRKTLHHPRQSFWARIYKKGDDLEFLHFTGFTRSAFDQLVEINSDYIISHPMVAGRTKPTIKNLRNRMYTPHDIVAMGLKFMHSKAELKDLCVQFGLLLQTFINCYTLCLKSFAHCLANHPLSRVRWDRSEENLKKCADRTEMFIDLPGVVAMVDGIKLVTKTSNDVYEQNNDYNGWTCDHNRNCILVWDPFGKIVDAVINAPGTFHDSKSTQWGNVYEHIKKLKPGYKCCCDDAFGTKGDLKDKLIKTKDEYREGFERSSYDMACTHLRQSSEWGNNILVGINRRLRAPLPLDNVMRALIMWNAILLHNFRTETVERNQIKTYFNRIVDEFLNEQK